MGGFGRLFATRPPSVMRFGAKLLGGFSLGARHGRASQQSSTHMPCRVTRIALVDDGHAALDQLSQPLIHTQPRFFVA